MEKSAGGRLSLLTAWAAAWMMLGSPFVYAGLSSSDQSCLSPHKQKPVNQKTLRTIVQSHGQWLEQRHDQTYHRAELCQADLHRALLAGANLERANLEGANLQQANLYQSILIHAHLAGANLTKAGLEDSNLS